MKNISIPLILVTQIYFLNADEDLASNENSSSKKNSYQHGEKFAEEMLPKSKVYLEKAFSNVKDLKMLLSNIPVGEGDGCKDCKSSIQNIPNKEADIENGIIVFASFSMPDNAIKELCREANKYGATVVIRGLHEDSFLKTKDKILAINSDGLSLSIHPDLFKQYDIKRVPTFVLVKNGKEIKKLSGNVSLEFAYKKLLEEQ